ncbi:hypothetical protein SAMN05660662_2675 [Blastococcus aurantiacus]|uniref:Uncharacterized protein n=1 Tax=Blastococcus aurantiacus TaxID=1550231 RepID=A0A1G7MF03_9ACTN|nr:hypothetical protein [Blastococcus aurantiacus]SDF60307.1 hypothetical protein SAMN05660662_2675 [Blastococcus aurantiacus]
MRAQTAAPYDYSRILRRTDPASSPLSLPIADQTVDVAAEMTGDLTATLPAIAAIWQQVSPDADTTGQMLRVLTAFTASAIAAGATTWHDVAVDDIASFIHAPGPSAGDVCRLRKNAVHGAYLALYDAGLFDDVSPAAGVDPVPEQVRNDDRGPIRTATHDEMLILRLATRLAVSSRAAHLSAAAVAICSASATTTEAPQVLWGHAGLTGDVPQLTLAGSPSATNDDEARIDARIVTLDRWEAEALTDWHTEVSAKDKPGKTSRAASATSVLYTGAQALDSNSAHAAVDQQVRKAFTIADLGRELGLSAGSLRLWAAARHVTEFATLITGANITGIDPFTLHRRVTRSGAPGPGSS